jgi:hypothetical protein
VVTAQLEDAEGDRVAFLEVADDGVGIDVLVADFSRDPAQVIQVTDDVNPQEAVALDGNRLAFVDFTSLSQDIALADLTSSRWLVASPAAEFQSAAGTDLVVFASADTSLGVFARATGGPNGDFDGVVLNLDLRAIDIDGDLSAVVLSSELLPIDAGGEDGTAAYGASPDGDALVFVDAARALRFGRLGAAGLSATTVLTTVPVTPVPFVDTELVDNVGTTVAQVGNVGGDLRRNATGTLQCIAHDGAGVVTSPARTIRRNGVDLTAARAPVIASVGGKVFMAYQDGGGAVRTRVCELNCAAAGAPTCSNDVALGVVGDAAPRISRSGLVVWVTQARSNFGDVAGYDVRSDRAILLTGVDGEEAPRSDVDVNGDRVIWADGRLGDFDIWESVQR